MSVGVRVRVGVTRYKVVEVTNMMSLTKDKTYNIYEIPALKESPPVLRGLKTREEAEAKVAELENKRDS